MVCGVVDGWLVTAKDPILVDRFETNIELRVVVLPTNLNLVKHCADQMAKSHTQCMALAVPHVDSRFHIAARLFLYWCVLN